MCTVLVIGGELRHTWTKVTALSKEFGCVFIRAKSPDGPAARSVLDGEVHASNHEQSAAAANRAENHGDEDRRDDRELHGRGPLPVNAERSEMMAHGQPSLMMAVVLIGVVNLLVTLRPGNRGAYGNVVCTLI